MIASQLAGISSITVEGDTTLTLYLSEVDYQLPLVLAGRNGQIVSPTAAGEDPEKLVTAPVGAGPFVLKNFVPEAEATLEKNPDYFAADDIRIERVRLIQGTDPASEIQSLQSGSLDVADIGPYQVEQAQAAGLEVDVIDSFNASTLNINNELAPFDDPVVTEAIRYGINRQELVDVWTEGTGDVSFQPFPEDYAAYDPELENLYEHDVEKAKQLLADAGYQPKELKTAITIHAGDELYGEILQSQFEDFGIDAAIDVVPTGSSTWQQKVYLTRSAQLATDRTIGRESPVANLEATLGPEGLMNASREASDEFIAALDAVRATPLDDPNYEEVLQKATNIGVRQAHNVPTFTTPRLVARNPDVSEFGHYLSQIRWDGVEIEGAPS